MPPANGKGRKRNGNGVRNGNGNGVRPNRGRRERQRRRARQRSKRRVLVIVGVLGSLVLMASLAAGAFTGGSAAFSCDLSLLRPVTIGQNSFIYAADGSLLGSIPAEKNRQPLPLGKINPRVVQATVAIEDRRFYKHIGVDVEGIFRAAVKNVEAGRIVEGGSTITQQLVRNLYIGNEKSFTRKTKEACLAIKLDAKWTKDRILQTYLNQVYFGNHAYGIEAASQTYFSKPAGKLNVGAGRAPRRAPAGALRVRSLQPAGRGRRAPERRPEGDARRGRHRPGALREGLRGAAQAQARRALHANPRALLLLVRARPPDQGVRRQHGAERRAQGVHDDRPPLSGGRDRRDQGDADRPGRPGVRRRLDQPGERRHPRHDGRRAAAEEPPVQPGRPGPAPGRVRVQDVRPHGGDRGADQSRLDVVPLGALPLAAGQDVLGGGRPELRVGGRDVRRELPSANISIASATLASDNTVYARLTLDVGPENVVDIARPDGDHDEARTSRLDRTRLELGLGARDGVRLRDARGRRGLLGADGDPQGRPRERARTTTRRAGARRSASARSRTVSPTR